MNFHAPISNRQELIEHLNIAAELEHIVLLQYLFAAFSMKKSTAEGLKPHQEPLVKWWEKTILRVAREEMGHLGTVCNLLSAVGAAPHFTRPSFPQPAGTYYPFEMRLTAFSDEALYRFVRFELPKGEPVPPPPSSLSNLNADSFTALQQPVEYEFVDQLYGTIRDGFARLKGLFIGPRFAQDTDGWSSGMHLGLVKDNTTAAQAIDFIISEGEGSPGDRHDSHYGAFVEMRQQLSDEYRQDPAFQPARNVAENPRAIERHGDALSAGSYITNEQTRKLAEIFNEVYGISLMLLIQFYSFGGETFRQRNALQEAARQLMSVATRPLGETLTYLPGCEPDDGRTAGAPFEFYSAPQLPPQVRPRWLMLLERLRVVSAALETYAGSAPQGWIVTRLRSIAQNIRWIKHNLKTVLDEEFVLDAASHAEVEV